VARCAGHVLADREDIRAVLTVIFSGTLVQVAPAPAPLAMASARLSPTAYAFTLLTAAPVTSRVPPPNTSGAPGLTQTEGTVDGDRAGIDLEAAGEEVMCRAEGKGSAGVVDDDSARAGAVADGVGDADVSAAGDRQGVGAQAAEAHGGVSFVLCYAIFLLVVGVLFSGLLAFSFFFFLSLFCLCSCFGLFIVFYYFLLFFFFFLSFFYCFF